MPLKPAAGDGAAYDGAASSRCTPRCDIFSAAVQPPSSLLTPSPSHPGFLEVCAKVRPHL
jgi:hypothetical protein